MPRRPIRIDSQAATVARNEAFGNGKLWLQEAILLGQAACDVGHEMVDEFHTTLGAADATQEQKRAAIPKAAEDFFVDKARLYDLPKRINHVGKAAHLREPRLRDNDNLSILHRRGVKRAEAEPVGAGAEGTGKG